jgi:hypothetical protein
MHADPTRPRNTLGTRHITATTNSTVKLIASLAATTLVAAAAPAVASDFQYL